MSHNHEHDNDDNRDFNRDPVLRIILSALRLVLDNQGRIMSAQDDLDQAITDLATDVSTEIAALAAAIANPGDPAAVEASVKRLQDLSVALKASVTPAAPAAPAA